MSFIEDWTAAEELLLLEGISTYVLAVFSVLWFKQLKCGRYGLGNWADVALHVGKSKQRCEQHFLDVYIQVELLEVQNRHGTLHNDFRI